MEVEVLTADKKVVKALAYLYNTSEKLVKKVWDPKEYEKNYGT